MAAEVRPEEPEPPPGTDLPGAAWQEVARRSRLRDVVTLGRTCKGLAAWLRGNTPLWAALLERDYGAAAAQQPQAAYLGKKQLYRELHGREAAVWARARGEALQAPSPPSSLASGARPPLLAAASNSRVVAVGRGDGYLKTFVRERRAGRPQWAPYEAMESRAAHWPEMVLALAVTREHAVSCGRRSVSVHRLEDGLEVLRLATGGGGGGARTDSGRRHSIAHSHAASRGGRPVNKVLAREDVGAQLELLDAGEDGTCRLYDAARLPPGGQEVLGGEGLVGHVGPVYALAWGPQPRTVLTGGFDGTVRLWDLRHGGEVAGPGADADRPGGGGWGPVFSLAARRGSPLLYSGHGDGAVRVWDMRKKGALGILRGHTRWVETLALGPKVLASAGGDCTVRLWDLKRLEATGGEGLPAATWRVHAAPVMQVGFHGPDSLVPASLDGGCLSHNLDDLDRPDAGGDGPLPGGRWPKLTRLGATGARTGFEHRERMLRHFLPAWRPPEQT